MMHQHVALLILSAGLFAGCTPVCGAWEDVVVAEEGTTEQRDAIEDAFATFAEWTGREETCVAEVVVVDTLESNGIPVAGSYSSLFHRISVVADEPFVEDVVLHELCHALDDEEGWPSLSGGDLFDTTGLNQLLYDTPALRMHEAFARICAEGPVLPAMWRRLEDTCDIDRPRLRGRRGRSGGPRLAGPLRAGSRHRRRGRQLDPGVERRWT